MAKSLNVRSNAGVPEKFRVPFGWFVAMRLKDVRKKFSNAKGAVLAVQYHSFGAIATVPLLSPLHLLRCLVLRCCIVET